jgi:hypothetical protein
MNAKLGEDVRLRLLHSAERQPRSNSTLCIAMHCKRARPAIARAYYKIFEMYGRLSHDLFLSLRGKLKEQERG